MNIDIVWGAYRRVGGLWMWEHNPNLKMSADEQYQENLKNPNFKAIMGDSMESRIGSFGEVAERHSPNQCKSKV